MPSALFQFTHPGKGATACLSWSSWRGSRFNSRTLGRVRPLSSCSAPRQSLGFNSRTLGRVRHSPGLPHPYHVCVSIHAPWEGCDTVYLFLYFPFLLFQFTHPGKGATSLSKLTLLQTQSFNSRTLGRVRPDRDALITLLVSVSIHAPWEGCDLL